MDELDLFFMSTVNLLVPRHPELVRYHDLSGPVRCYKKFLCIGRIRQILHQTRCRLPDATRYTDILVQYCSFQRTGRERRAANRSILILREQFPEERRYSCTMTLFLLERYYLYQYPEHIGLFTMYRWCALATDQNETFSRTLADIVKDVKLVLSTSVGQSRFAALSHSLIVSHIGEEEPHSVLCQQVHQRNGTDLREWVLAVVQLMQKRVQDDVAVRKSCVFFGVDHSPPLAWCIVS
jgi:hypothetical protein